MKLGQKVLVTWGTYKGLTGVITETRYTKNITLKLDAKPFEIEVSADHLELIEEQQQDKIMEFLQYLYEQDLKWFEELKADYKEKGYKEYIEMLKKNEITKTVLNFAKMTSQDAAATFKKDLDNRYAKLINKVEKKVGKVISIEVKRNYNEGFDGLVTGEKGTCRLTTILAGGHSIQRLHYRTLCK